MSFPIAVYSKPLLVSGNAFVNNVDTNAVYLVYNLTGATGSPNLVFTIAESDPISPGTLIAGGQTASTGTISTNTSGILPLTGIGSGCVLVSWALSGGTFANANLTITRKISGLS